MRQLVTVTEVEGEGLESFLGQPILIFAANYIYAGKLVGVNNTFVKLEEPKIVYETGPLNVAGYKYAEAFLGKNHYVQISAIESFGPGK